MSKRTVRLTESELKRIITESVKIVLRESAWNNEQFESYMNEIAAIDPDVTEGWSPDFEQYPELRNTRAYKMAYKHVDRMDWYINGDIDIDDYDLHELSSDAERDTSIPRDVLYQAMVDYLEQELGYEV